MCARYVFTSNFNYRRWRNNQFAENNAQSESQSLIARFENISLHLEQATQQQDLFGTSRERISPVETFGGMEACRFIKNEAQAGTVMLNCVLYQRSISGRNLEKPLSAQHPREGETESQAMPNAWSMSSISASNPSVWHLLTQRAMLKDDPSTPGRDLRAGERLPMPKSIIASPLSPTQHSEYPSVILHAACTPNRAVQKTHSKTPMAPILSGLNNLCQTKPGVNRGSARQN